MSTLPPTELPTNIFTSVIESISEPVVVTDVQLDEPGPRIIYVNKAFEEMTGYSLSEIRGKSPRLLQGPETERDVLADLRAALESGRSFHGRATNYRKDKSPFEIEWRIEQFPEEADEPLYYVAVQRNVTAEEKIKRQRDRLELLHLVNDEVAGEGLSLDRVRARITELAIEITDAEASVVEEPEGDEIVYTEVAGLAEGKKGLRLPMKDSISGLCFRSRQTLVVDDSETDDRIPLKDKARELGFRSGILSPLLHRGRIFGVLKVYSSRPHFFSDAEERSLRLASGILSSSLFAAAEFEREVERRHVLLDAVPILIAFVDRQRRYTEVNAAHQAVVGRSISEIRGMHMQAVLGSDDYDRLRPYVDAAFRGESVSFEVTLEGFFESDRIYRGNLEPHFGSEEEVTGCYVAMQDITDARFAESDYLTGLLNRRKFEELATYLLASRDRSEAPVSLLMIDIDHFKEINDEHGHAAGDEVLRGLGEVFSDTVRQADLVCRWGGEEFVVLLFDADLEHAVESAERIRGAIDEYQFEEVGSVSVSVGVAQALGEESLGSLQERADAALYEAKSGGRDLVQKAPATD
jgi:diguanylate cyclase (GGDEF)-like protein/PAS domain S-box-containing protein